MSCDQKSSRTPALAAALRRSSSRRSRSRHATPPVSPTTLRSAHRNSSFCRADPHDGGEAPSRPNSTTSSAAPRPTRQRNRKARRQHPPPADKASMVALVWFRAAGRNRRRTTQTQVSRRFPSSPSAGEHRQFDFPQVRQGATAPRSGGNPQKRPARPPSGRPLRRACGLRPWATGGSRRRG
jgi:hypothetical protein